MIRIHNIMKRKNHYNCLNKKCSKNNNNKYKNINQIINNLKIINQKKQKINRYKVMITKLFKIKNIQIIVLINLKIFR